MFKIPSRQPLVANNVGALNNQPQAAQVVEPPKPKKLIILTPEELRKETKGHIKVQPDKWNLIPYGARIKVLKLDGTFSYGGYINSKREVDGQMIFKLQSKSAKQIAMKYTNGQVYTYWIKLSEVKEIFMKMHSESSIEVLSIIDFARTQAKQVVTLQEKVLTLEKRLQQLEKSDKSSEKSDKSSEKSDKSSEKSDKTDKSGSAGQSGGKMIVKSDTKSDKYDKSDKPSKK